jgi:hypothetical protein
VYLSFDDEAGNRSHVERGESQYPEAYVVSFVKLQPLSSPIISAAANVSALLPPLRIITTSKAILVNESLNVILEISARMGEVSFRSESIPGVEFITRYAQTFQGSDSECAQRVQISTTRSTHNTVYSSSMTLSGNLSSMNRALSDLQYKADIGMSSAAFGQESVEMRLLSPESFLTRERAGRVAAESFS